jgi:cGMP-dependent protein kinase
LFIIKEGIVNCLKGEKEIRKLANKDYFGESAILFETRRSLSVIAHTNIQCYLISKEILIESLGEDYKQIILQSITKGAFEKNVYMTLLMLDTYFAKVYSCFEIKFYQNNTIVLNKDDHNKKVIIVLEGNLSDSETNEIRSTRSEIYIEHLVKKEKLRHNIIANSDCITLEADWLDLIEKLQLNIDERKVLKFLSRLWQVKNLQIFKHFSDSKLIEICKKMRKEKFYPKNVIVKEGEVGDKLFLIIKGTVKVYKNDKYLREVTKGSFFGEISLLIEDFRSATVIAEDEVTMYSLSKEDFITYIDNNMFDFLIKKISLLDNFKIELDDLYYIKSLGKGKFGNVSLVHNGKNHYAIKAVNQYLAQQSKLLIKYFLDERNILLTLDHPFIMKLVKTMKNKDHIFYLMEYISGTMLSSYISKKIRDNLKFQIQFYIASLILIIDYLNSKSICHRDIKPDNIMIDEKGYLKLIDFGTATAIKDFTHTIIGTPHYMAPEVLLGKGYGYSCDYWSIGIIAYEIYYGKFPYGDKAKDPMDVYKEIIKK